nr:YitT family protein [Bacillus atrophaeus]
MIRKKGKRVKREFVLRWAFYFIGLLILSFGISLTIEGKALGISPWDAFHYGLFQHFGLTIGQWAIIIGAIIVCLTSVFTKALPKIGALLNMVLIGIFIDFFNILLPEPSTYTASVIVFSLGVLLIGYGVGVYVSAGLGAGPRDSLMMLISEKTGWNVQWVRNGIELTILAVAWGMGGPIGIGTIITAILTGLILRFSLPQSTQLLRYMLMKRVEKVSQTGTSL